MPDGAHNSEQSTRSGDFFFKVWRRDGAAWSWRLRIEVVETGEWGIFDSMQEALGFMRQHMTADVDADADADIDSEPLPVTSEAAAVSWDCLEEQDELVSHGQSV
jgi:hypothetical protein